MKYIVLVLAMVAIGCKKDTPQSLVIGKWEYVGSLVGTKYTVAPKPAYYIFKDAGQMVFISEAGKETNMQYAFIDEWLYINAYTSEAVGWKYNIDKNKMELFTDPNSKLMYERR